MSSNTTGLSVGEWVAFFAVLVVGVGLSLWLVLSGMMVGQDDATRFEVPGEAAFNLTRAGNYVVYHEMERTADRLDLLRPPGIETLRVHLQHVDTGERIPLEDALGDASYVLRQNFGESLYRFRAQQAGDYLLLAESEDPEAGGVYTLVVSQDYRARFLAGFAGGAAVFLLTALFVAAIAYRAYRRTNAKGQETP